MLFKNFYAEIFKINTPHSYQIELWNLINENKYPLIVKAPTGSGKTEGVIAPFLSQFIENRYTIAPRMIYVLPMRVLVDDIAGRIKKYTEKISPHILVEVQHGDMPNVPFFMADIVVTTLDQFLYGFARASSQVGRHLDIPAGSIASSIVVFDEAHMYRDGFTFSVMRALMEILQKSRIPFVLMTATMPESLENSLIEDKELFKDVFKIKGEIYSKNSLKISLEDYPLYSNDKVNISDNLLDRIKNHKTLVVVNQVKRAQKIYDEIKTRLNLKDEEIVLLHSRFTRVDRKNHGEKAITLLPHKENGRVVIPEGTGIVVSTQVLEAGMNFSAELLLTELAPSDSLVQRAGRCARFEGENGEMIIFPVEKENKGHLPYEQEHLLKTFKWLQNNKQFNIKNFDEVCSFVDETLDYQANDYEARDTLIDLYECVLYADERPTNIQLRDGKPITLVVVDISKEKDGNKKNKIQDAIRKTDIHENSINVDISVGWGLWKNGILKLGLNFDSKKNEWNIVELKKEQLILPFKHYLLEKENYDQLKGVISDANTYII
ncbi:MAG: CRISPR-associated helicase Cas3' [Syntrophorhabdaceae bacterium]|nr:CRISPR-associated helicase Cas3' [Syntrophorhabdaceae bacterium]